MVKKTHAIALSGLRPEPRNQAMITSNSVDQCSYCRDEMLCHYVWFLLPKYSLFDADIRPVFLPLCLIPADTTVTLLLYTKSQSHRNCNCLIKSNDIVF